MRWPWLVSGLLLLVAIAQQEPEPSFQTTAEIERRGKKIVVVKTGPDNPPAIIELRDLYGGIITALDAEKKTLSLGEQPFTTDKLTRFWHEGKQVQFADLKVGQQVRLEAAEQNDGSLKAFDVQIGGKREGPSLSRSLFADPPPFRVQITFGEDARAFGAIARVEQVREVNDFVFMTGGTARYIEEEDRLELELKPAPRAVEVQQGKSKAWGSRLDYDNESGDARVAGPIELERAGDKPLQGSAQRMVYNVDDEVLRLFGGVKLVQDARTTTADSAVVREKDRVAYLFGSKDRPVRSQNKDGFVEGTRVLYNLDTSDVVVLEGVKGEFQDP
jgi:lipopolysaccharide export system protein LptA